MKGRFYHGFEVCSPRYCARHFGLTQAMPMPIPYSFEFPFMSKLKYKSSENEPFDCCSKITKTIHSRYSIDIEEFRPNPDRTPEWAIWWTSTFFVDRFEDAIRFAMEWVKPFNPQPKQKVTDRTSRKVTR